MADASHRLARSELTSLLTTLIQSFQAPKLLYFLEAWLMSKLIVNGALIFSIDGPGSAKISELSDVKLPTSSRRT